MFSGKSEISDTEGKKYIFFPIVKRFNSVHDKREFKRPRTATATGTSLNKRFNEQNNCSARAL